MHEPPDETATRVAAWRVLREAREAIEEMIGEAVRTNDTRPMYDKLKRWLPIVLAAERDVGNVIGELDPAAHVMETRQIAAKLRQLGQRKTDEIAGKLERACSMVMDAD
jgi:hypothetical protein